MDGLIFNKTYTKKVLESVKLERGGSENFGVFPGQSDNLQTDMKVPWIILISLQ